MDKKVRNDDGGYEKTQVLTGQRGYGDPCGDQYGPIARCSVSDNGQPQQGEHVSKDEYRQAHEVGIEDDSGQRDQRPSSKTALTLKDEKPDRRRCPGDEGRQGTQRGRVESGQPPPERIYEVRERRAHSRIASQQIKR